MKKDKPPKRLLINRDDPFIIDLFKKICQEKKEQNISRVKINKGKMKAYLSKKYKGKIAEKILVFLDIQVALDFNSYIDLIEKLINF
jgi:PP-loop superfamily ATP-utilizing enzyme